MGCEKGNLMGIFLFSIALSALLFLPMAMAEESCIEITPITTFHDGDSAETLVIEGGMSDTSSKILVPMDMEIYSASLDVTGEPIDNETAMDMIILSDVSASMNESIEEMKSDTKDMFGFVLAYRYNKAGLVSFRRGIVDVEELTDNEEELSSVVDTYVSEGSTCIACAINKGVELLKDRGTPHRVMLLLTNGEANRCDYGGPTGEVCTNPKSHTISKAAQAWTNYGIRIYAVPYEDDSDLETLQSITDAAHGELYDQGTPMSEVYSDIEELFTGTPKDVVLDVGDDGSEEFSHAGVFLGTENVDFTAALADLLSCECDGCEVVDGEWWGECLIDLKVSSSETGVIILDNLMITGCLNQTTECTPGETMSCPVQEGVCEGSQETCPESGFWTGECDYSGMEGYEEEEVTCDNMDNDCDGSVDEGVKNAYYFDNDNDGYGSGSPIEACFPPEGYRTSSNDCDDSNPNVHPGASESCNGIDDDCDGSVDEGCGGGGGGGGGGTTYYCGDGLCYGTETCETCEEDCGECCEPSWSCSEWGECSQENLQTRECTDENACGTRDNIPSELRPCTYTPSTGCGNGVCETSETCETCEEDCGVCPPGDGAEVEETPPEGFGLLGMFTAGQVTGIAALMGLIIILLLLFLATKRKKKK